MRNVPRGTFLIPLICEATAIPELPELRGAAWDADPSASSGQALKVRSTAYTIHRRWNRSCIKMKGANIPGQRRIKAEVLPGSLLKN